MTALVSSADVVLRSLADHLWQSTLVAGGAAGLCLLLRRYRAQVRHAIWMAASLKFLVPIALLTTIGGWVPWPAPVRAWPEPASAIRAVGLPFSVPDGAASLSETEAAGPIGASPAISVPVVLLIVWFAGSLVAIVRRAARTRRAQSIRRSAIPVAAGRDAEAFARLVGRPAKSRVVLRSSPLCTSPCVVGWWRPALLWPDGIGNRLSDAQLDAIMAHEIAHVRRRDNLAAAAHALVEVLFWFHPLVWWIGGRLVEERERACDEDVLQSGAAPDVYADGILKICESSIGAPAPGLAGITGPTLTHRIEAIMTPDSPQSLGWLRRALLIAAAVMLAAGPVAAGAMNKPAVQAVAGSIAGTVTDQMGGIMAGVTVTARPASGGALSGVSDADGRYVIAGVPAGEYELRVAQPGFKTHVQQLLVRAGLETPVNVELRIGSLSEQVTLRAPQDPPAPDPAAAAASESELLARAAQSPDDPSSLLALAYLYYRQERFAESEEMMRRATEIIGRRAAELRSTYVVTLPRGGVVAAPKKIRDVKPIYPAIARTARVSGNVIIEATIAEDGTVRDARVLRSVPLLDAAALGAVRQWLFTPTRLNGVPIEVVITATVSFVQ